ncbi:arginine--tRNA ligase [bacterium]|nr:arginine--tRNA ligase [bacterium]
MSLKNYALQLKRRIAAVAAIHFEIAAAELPAFEVSPSSEARFGHFACNLAMQLARPLKRNPRQIAEELAERLNIELGEELAAPLAPVGQGFLNLHLSEHLFGEAVNEVLTGASPFQWQAEKPQQINLEYVSANPTGPLLVVNGRAAALGSALASILKAAGHSVTQEYFVNDAGTQVIEFGKSVFRENRDRYREAGWEISDEVYAWGDDGGYAAKTVAEVSESVFQLREETACEKKYTRSAQLFEITDSVIAQLEFQRASLGRFGADFQRFYSEHLLYAPDSRLPYQDVLTSYIFPEMLDIEQVPGPIRDAWHTLKEHGSTFEADGAIWLRTTEYGDDKDRVIIRSNGKPTYLLADIAYHLNKWERLENKDDSGDAPLMIDIWGPDHYGHILPTRAGLMAAGLPEEALEVLIAGWVTFKQGEKVVAMSKRKGNLITLDDLMDEVGVDVARFLFLERSPEAELEFDLEMATEQSSENPAYYVQYAHARICSIFSKALEEGYSEEQLISTELSKIDMAPLFTEDDAGRRQAELLRQLIYYPGVIQSAARGRAPQRLAHYLHHLAGEFHPWYKMVKVLVDDRETALARLALCAALRKLITHGLGLLGLNAPESM